jgi:hypothetical protein
MYSFGDFQRGISPESPIFYCSQQQVKGGAGGLPLIIVSHYAYGFMADGRSAIFYEEGEVVSHLDVKEEGKGGLLVALVDLAKERRDAWATRIKVFAADRGMAAYHGRLDPQGDALRSALADLLDYHLEAINIRLSRLEEAAKCTCGGKSGGHGSDIIEA